MPRKPLLDQELTHILTTRIHISRALHIFTLESLRSNWTISKPTLYRYAESKYRETSREYAKKRNVRSKEQNTVMKGKCWKCSEDTYTHGRCQDCTVLLHGTMFCQSCIDTRRRRILKESEIVDVTNLFSL